MKKATSQVFVAVVCGLLGFLLAYQFKVLSEEEKGNAGYDNTDIIAEIESLKKEKEELAATNSTLSEDLKKLEESVGKEGEVATQITNQLNTARMQLGLVDVKGPGIVVTIKPKIEMFGSENSTGAVLGDAELIHLVNILWYAGAEAMEINDIRITPQTGIRGANKWINIGSAAGRVDPQKEIVIKAIGDKARLEAGINFQDAKSYGALRGYEVKPEQSSDIIIKKTTQSLKNEYIYPVKE